MRAKYKPQIIESVFYDSAASDAEDDAFIAAVRRRATVDGGDSPTAAARGLPVAPPAHGDDATRARVRAIRKAIVGEGDALRARHPWLEPAQDAIGAALIAVCVATNVAVAVGFAKGAVGWPVAIVVAAFAQSILHEIEHDLIHGCYFLKRFGPSSVNAALAVVYACRLSTINPWSRRKLHINHHVASGTRADLEERAITNGQPWGPFRLLLTGDNALAVALRPMASLREFRDYVRTLPEADAVTNPKHYLRVRAVLLAYNAGGYFPFGAAHYGAWYAFLVDAALKAAGLPAGLLGAGTAAAAAARVYAAAFAAPNFMRTFCLHFVSSNVHYVGIGRGDVMNQTQVLTSPIFYPFQLFCFNFGGTHAIHHFVVRDPFYIRQAIAGRVLPVMRANGVRFNDFGTFARANRLPGADAKAKLR
jgi:fatty acid desaturase